MKNKLIVGIAVLLGVACHAQKQPSTRISIDFGYGYRTAEVADNIPPQLKDYIEESLSGLNIDTHLGFFIKPNWGLGIVHNRFQSNNEIIFATPISIGGIEAFETSDDISISFIAPELFFRSLSANEKHSFISTLSIGYLAYKDKATLNGIDIENTGGTAGFGFGFMYDYHITPTIAIGAGANFIAGSLSKIDLNIGGQTQEVELPDDQKENLSRITINAGLRFYL